MKRYDMQIVQSTVDPRGVSVRDLDGRASTFKINLGAAGFKPGDRVSVVLTDDLEWLQKRAQRVSHAVQP